MRKRYVPDLKQIGAQCESNYLRLQRLLADAGEGDCRAFVLEPGLSQVQIMIEEEHPYTSMLDVRQQGGSQWLLPPQMKVRLYHDAGMAEVIRFHNQHRFEGRYTYPNKNMLQPDEKWQINRFLAEWLDHCLRHGLAHSATQFAPAP
ncbi:hypothetical protein GCM10011297_24360 [Bacterioplanes sanyensis]|uniref:DUF1249 domain-containing protein n=1 Tax=Bacterioplanes sanyensis TaxID=1249553 RepID=UPI00167C3C24|nr:DUF1249 domain-containing protein [Bacterioplanes sanyensis]GGY50615.1 hypothetical protein GCM10011297_24360 [Bacterioplanes sanyensis]